MYRNRRDEEERDSRLSAWDPESHRRCIVCNEPSNGKAICGDSRCAEELARG